MLFAVAAIIPFAYIAPAYAAPRPMSEAELPANLAPVHARFGEGIELVGYRVDDPYVRPGERAGLTLYWRALAPMDADYNLFLHVLGRASAEVGKVDTWPGGGRLPTSQWQTGAIYADGYLIPISPSASAPTWLRLDVGFWENDLTDRRLIFDAHGARIPTVTLDVGRLIPTSTPVVSPLYPEKSTLEGGITFLGYDLAGPAAPNYELPITFYWTTTAPVSSNFTVFVHLDSAGGQTLAQADSPPLAGDWPTSAWLPGSPVTDERSILLPADILPGQYVLRLGLYEPATGARLAAWDASGREWPDWAIVLAQPVVVK